MGDAVLSLRIDADRMQGNFRALAEIGATPGGGVHRPAFSEAHLEARQWFREQAVQAGLEVRIDGAGNHSARLDFGASRTLLLGSHLDSVPNGGRFDGALGVLCALEVLQTLCEAGVSLAVDLEAIDLTDEEGAYLGLFGSRALAGKLREEDLGRAHGGRAALERALASAGLTLDGVLSAQRAPDSLAGYLELHIEQGARLAQSGIDIGVVTDIVGIGWHRVRFTGRADHAGTTPMELRRDAALGASAFALAVRETVMEQFAGCVANVGRMDFIPGAFNVVPAAVDVALEVRAPDQARLARLERALFDRARAQSARFGLGLEVEPLERIDPRPMDQRVCQVIGEAAEGLGLTHTLLASGAGHDAQSFADLCPAGMVFVPSTGGHSHSAQECTPWLDCVHGANVLLQTVLRMSAKDWL